MTSLLKGAQRLPAFNWNYTFFGSHRQTVNKGWNYPKETHTAFEVIYVLKGSEEIEYDNVSYLVNETEFIIIAPNTAHRCIANTNLTYFTFHFDLDDPVLEEMLIGNPKVVYQKEDEVTSQITKKFDRMLDVLSDNMDGDYDFGDRIQIQIQLSQVIAKLYDSIKKINLNKNLYNVQYAKRIRSGIKNEVNRLIYDTEGADFIESTDVIKKVSEQLNLSVGYANRIFHESYGLSPKAYLSTVKQQIAQSLLLKPQYSINDISTMMGYKNSGNFSRQFKIWTGYSPLHFRSKQPNYFLDKKLFSENFVTYNEDPDNEVYRSFEDDK